MHRCHPLESSLMHCHPLPSASNVWNNFAFSAPTKCGNRQQSSEARPVSNVLYKAIWTWLNSRRAPRTTGHDQLDPMSVPTIINSYQFNNFFDCTLAILGHPRNVERMIKSNMGKPQQQEKALARFIASLNADDIYILRKQIYQRQGCLRLVKFRGISLLGITLCLHSVMYCKDGAATCQSGHKNAWYYFHIFQYADRIRKDGRFCRHSIYKQLKLLQQNPASLAGSFRLLQPGKIISSSQPPACTSLPTKSSRWQWRCTSSLEWWLRRVVPALSAKTSQ